MYKLNEKESVFVKDNFGTVKLFRSYCDDYLVMRLTEGKKVFPHIEIGAYSSGGESGITTCIVYGVYYDSKKNQMILSIIIEGVFRWAIANDDTMDRLLDVQNKLRKDPGKYTAKEIEDFEFLVRKPFVTKVYKNVIDLIKPLRFDIYEEAIELETKIVAEEIE